VSAAASSSSLASPAALPSHLLPHFPSRSSPAAGPRWRSGTRWRSRSSPSHLRRRHSLGVEIRCWEDQLLTERIEIFVFSSAPLLDHATRAAAHRITRLRLYAYAPAASPYLPAAAGPHLRAPPNPRRAAAPSSHRALLARARRRTSPVRRQDPRRCGTACALLGTRPPCRRGTTCVPPQGIAGEARAAAGPRTLPEPSARFVLANHRAPQARGSHSPCSIRGRRTCSVVTASRPCIPPRACSSPDA
jgi:hypothetical protein